MVEIEDLVEDEIVDEDGCHFEVIDGEDVGFHPCDDVWGPSESPNAGMDGAGAGSPDSAGAKLAGIGVANEGRQTGEELDAFGGPIANDFEHGLEVGNGVSLGGVGMDVDGGLGGGVCAVEESIEGGQEGGAPGDGMTGMLTLPKEGLEGFAVHFAVAEELVAGIAEGLDFAGGEFNGALDAIKDPAQDFLAGGPDALPLEDEFLLGDGIFAVMPCGCWRGENLVDGVEEGPTVVSEGVRIGGLDQGTIVIHKTFNEGGHSRSLVGGGGWGQGVEWGFDGVEHVVFHWVWGKGLEGGEEVGDVSPSFRGRAEIGWAGRPAHLESSRNDNERFGMGVVGVRWQDIAELFVGVVRHHHSPETILNVEFSKEDGSVGVREGADLVDEALDDRAKLVHGVGGGGIFVGEFIDGFCVGAALAFGGEVEDHAEQAALVRDGRDGADFCVAFAVCQDLAAELTPGDELGKALFHFLQGFLAAGGTGLGGFRGGVGTISNGLIQFLEGPIFCDFDGASGGSKFLEGRAEGMLLC